MLFGGSRCPTTQRPSGENDGARPGAVVNRRGCVPSMDITHTPDAPRIRGKGHHRSVGADVRVEVGGRVGGQSQALAISSIDDIEVQVA